MGILVLLEAHGAHFVNTLLGGRRLQRFLVGIAILQAIVLASLKRHAIGGRQRKCGLDRFAGVRIVGFSQVDLCNRQVEG